MAHDWTKMHEVTARTLTHYASGGTLVVGAVTITACVESLARAETVAERWGADAKYALSLTVPRSLLTAGLPAARSLVTYRGASQRVLSTDENRHAGTVVLNLGDL